MEKDDSKFWKEREESRTQLFVLTSGMELGMADQWLRTTQGLQNLRRLLQARVRSSTCRTLPVSPFNIIIWSR